MIGPPINSSLSMGIVGMGFLAVGRWSEGWGSRRYGPCVSQRMAIGAIIAGLRDGILTHMGQPFSRPLKNKEKKKCL